MLKILSLKPRQKTDKGESGNVFLFILIGVVLFAALGYSVAKGFRSDTSSTLTKKQIDLAADDILTYTQKISRTVDRLRRSGCSESEISFENPTVSGYEFVTRDECKVFDTAGGALTYRAPNTKFLNANNDSLDGFNDYFFTASTASPEAKLTGVDLLIVLPYLKHEICEKINERLSIDGVPQDSGSSFLYIDARKYTGNNFGSFVINGEWNSLNTAKSGCLEGDTNPSSGTYHFYSELIAR